MKFLWICNSVLSFQAYLGGVEGGRNMQKCFIWITSERNLKDVQFIHPGKLPFELHFISWGFLEGYNITLTFYVNLKSLKDYKLLVNINN